MVCPFVGEESNPRPTDSAAGATGVHRAWAGTSTGFPPHPLLDDLSCSVGFKQLDALMASVAPFCPLLSSHFPAV